MRAGGAVILGLGLLALAACSPAAPHDKAGAPAKPAAAAKTPAAQDQAAGWMAWQGTGGPAAAAWPDLLHPRIVIRCDERRRLLLVIFPDDPPDQAIAHESLSVTGGQASLAADMHFRSPEDAAGDDPPAWAELTPGAQVDAVLAGNMPLGFRRSDPHHPAIQAAAPGAAVHAIVRSCR